LRDRLAQNSAIVGEICQHIQPRREYDDRNHVSLGHLLLHELVGRIVRANQVVRLHRSEIEKQYDQAAVAQRIADRVRGRRVRSFIINRDDDWLVVLGCRSFDCFDVRVRKRCDRLRFAFVRHRKLICGQVFDCLAGLVGDFHINANQVRRTAQHRGGLVRGLLCWTLRCARRGGCRRRD
jgi:hypothetical protein